VNPGTNQTSTASDSFPRVTLMYDDVLSASGPAPGGAFRGTSTASTSFTSPTYTTRFINWIDALPANRHRAEYPPQSDVEQKRQELKAIVESYHFRPHDWDGRGGHAPTEEAIGDATSFLDQLHSISLFPDNVFSTGDGEIAFQWRRDLIFVEVGFFGDHTISWFARSEQPETIALNGDDTYDRRDPKLPSKLVSALLSLVARQATLLCIARTPPAF
jgi:hypothetical protein